MGATQRLIEAGEARFEAEGDGYIFWRKPETDGVRISAAEHARFLAAGRRNAARLAWVCNGWTIVGSLAAAYWVEYRFGILNGWMGIATLFGVAAVFVGVLRPFEVRPERELRGRPGIGRHSAGRPPWHLRRRRTAQETRWRTLAYEFVITLVFGLNLSSGFDRHSSFCWAGAAACAFGLLCIADLAVRKAASRTPSAPQESPRSEMG